MTNRERLNSLDNKAYLSELERVFVSNPFRIYIDYDKWLDSENTDTSCCLKAIGEGRDPPIFLLTSIAALCYTPTNIKGETTASPTHVNAK